MMTAAFAALALASKAAAAVEARIERSIAGLPTDKPTPGDEPPPQRLFGENHFRLRELSDESSDRTMIYFHLADSLADGDSATLDAARPWGDSGGELIDDQDCGRRPWLTVRLQALRR
jgi:hypothetical protein